MFTQIPQEWLLGLAGGLVIGTASALLLLFNARILGASGILSGLFEGGGRSNFTEKLAFIAALIGAPALVVAVRGAPESHVSGNLPLMIVAGVLVGIGTKLANGCTSGHGVCGMSRFSLRSIVATLVYLAAGMIGFYLVHHVWGVI